MRIPKPWFREQNQTWYVTLDGIQHNLGKDESRAKEEYADLLKSRKQAESEDNVRRLLVPFPFHKFGIVNFDSY